MTHTVYNNAEMFLWKPYLQRCALFPWVMMLDFQFQYKCNAHLHATLPYWLHPFFWATCTLQGVHKDTASGFSELLSQACYSLADDTVLGPQVALGTAYVFDFDSPLAEYHWNLCSEVREVWISKRKISWVKLFGEGVGRKDKIGTDCFGNCPY